MLLFSNKLCILYSSFNYLIYIILYLSEFFIETESSIYIYIYIYIYIFALLLAQAVKSLPTMWDTWIWSLDWEDSLEMGMATPLQYSCLDNSMDRGRGLQSMGSQRVRHEWETNTLTSLSYMKMNMPYIWIWHIYNTEVKRFFYEVLAHAIMETEKSQDLPYACCRSRQADGIDWRPEPWKAKRWGFQFQAFSEGVRTSIAVGRKWKNIVPFHELTQRESESSHTSYLVLSKPSRDWMMPICMGKRNPCYLFYRSKC